MRVPRLTEEEITAHLAGLPEWARKGEGIVRTYRLAGFAPAVAFVNLVADAAEEADHHPDIDIRFAKVTLRLTTHDSLGLTLSDMRLAAACDALADGVGQ